MRYMLPFFTNLHSKFYFMRAAARIGGRRRNINFFLAIRKETAL